MMGKRRSLKEFIAENFEDQIYQSVEKYYNASKTRINITSNRFYSITDANSPYEMQIKFHNGYENSTDEKQTEYLRKTQEEEFEIFKSLPRDFKGTIEVLKKWRKLTNKSRMPYCRC